MKQSSTLFVGLGVHTDSINIATADAGRDGEVRFVGSIGGDLAALDKSLRKLVSRGHRRPGHPARHRGWRAQHVCAGGFEERRVRASEDQIARSLQGNWRAEHLFSLRQALDAFDFCGKQLQQCDDEIDAQLARLHITGSSPTRAGSAARRATRRSSTCARGCSRCAAWTSHESTAST